MTIITAKLPSDYIGKIPKVLIQLLKLFQEYGTVETCTLVLDAATGKSKGFAFVEMPHGREAVKAIKGLNTLRLHGHGIRVKAAEDKPQA